MGLSRLVGKTINSTCNYWAVSTGGDECRSVNAVGTEPNPVPVARFSSCSLAGPLNSKNMVMFV